MKKIMFNDRYGLTEAVLERRKTMTRRIIDDYNMQAALEELWEDDNVGGTNWNIILDRAAKYKVDEVVAIAQSYKDVADSMFVKGQLAANEENPQALRQSAGWNNKMFTVAYYMPHRIEITGRRIERLQDISDNDCIREGICWCHGSQAYYVNYNQATGSRVWLNGKTPQEAFADLIDKVSKRSVWGENPWVIAYSFKLVL